MRSAGVPSTQLFSLFYGARASSSSMGGGRGGGRGDRWSLLTGLVLGVGLASLCQSLLSLSFSASSARGPFSFIASSRDLVAVSAVRADALCSPPHRTRAWVSLSWDDGRGA